MKISNIMVILVIMAVALSGIHCKKSEDPTGPEEANFDGTWVANSATAGTKMIYDASETNPLLVADVVPLGATLSITVVANNFSLILVEPGEDPFVDTGDFLVEDNNITLTSEDPEGEVLSFQFTLEGNMLTLRADDVFFPGLEDTPAKLTVILKRIS